MPLPVTGAPLAEDTPSARALAFLARVARFTPGDWARTWRRFEASDLVAYAVARRALAEALTQLHDDALVARTQRAAVAVTDRLPVPNVPGAADRTPGGPRYMTAHAAFAALCRPLLPADAYAALGRLPSMPPSRSSLP